MDVFAGSVYDVALCIPPTPKTIFGYRSSPAVPLRDETDIFGQVSEYDTKIIHLDLDKRKGLGSSSQGSGKSNSTPPLD